MNDNIKEDPKKKYKSSRNENSRKILNDQSSHYLSDPRDESVHRAEMDYLIRGTQKNIITIMNRTYGTLLSMQ